MTTFFSLIYAMIIWVFLRRRFRFLVSFSTGTSVCEKDIIRGFFAGVWGCPWRFWEINNLCSIEFSCCDLCDWVKFIPGESDICFRRLSLDCYYGEIILRFSSFCSSFFKIGSSFDSSLCFFLILPTLFFQDTMLISSVFDSSSSSLIFFLALV